MEQKEAHYSLTQISKLSERDKEDNIGTRLDDVRGYRPAYRSTFFAIGKPTSQ